MRLPFADFHPGFQVALAWIALATASPAQDELAAAVAAFQRSQTAPEAQRATVLAELAHFVGEEVTEILLWELAGALSVDYRVAVIEAIGSKTREGAIRPLMDQLVLTRSGPTVRRAAAAAIAGQGNQGIDLLRDMVLDPPGGSTRRGQTLRRVCLHGLSQAGSDRAWRVVAEQTLEGSISGRLEVLAFLQPAPNSSTVRRAREACLRDTDVRIASVALRQLIEHGYSRGGRAARDLCERLGARPRPAVRVAMIHAIAGALERDLYVSLLEVAALDQTAVQRAIADVSPTVSRDRAFVRWLAEVGLQQGLPAERKAAARLLQAGEADVLAVALQPIRRRLRTPGDGKVDLILALHPVLKGDPSWRDDVIAIAGSVNATLRTVGLGLLAQMGDPAGLSIAHRSLAHRDWEVRSAAYDYCGTVRNAASIPLLIRRLDRETNRLREDLLDALQALTAMRFWDSAQWNQWWDDREDGFQLSPLREWKRGSSSTTTISYYNIPLVSNRVAFLLDVSGSMNERIGTSRNLTRLREAKRQLELVIKAMPEDYGFNIIYYSTEVKSVSERLERATPEAKERALNAVSRLQPVGGTNIYGALQTAFDDPDIDTIYLLTDGQPSGGLIVDPVEIADQVARWNGSRRIRIHGIAVGIDSVLIKSLADDSGGIYVYVR